jgi:NAD(P)-dependent dehydrogenase (short-subunit alcohol dehydrogenase family)
MNTNTNLKDKKIVITGATAGIGRAATRALVAQGANVIAVGRSAARCAETKKAIMAKFPEGQLTFIIADLSSQRSVRKLADQIRAQLADQIRMELKSPFDSPDKPYIDILVNNAGTVSSWYTATEDGYELQFAVNHLAPFLLTNELLPLLEAAPQGRVITTSSNSHRGTKIRWDDVMNRRRYNCLRAYKQSKLANVLFSYEFNRRMASSNNGSQVRAFAVDPGLVNTDIGLKGTGGIEKWVWGRRSNGGVSPEQGAETIVHLAAAETLEDTDAAYWKNCHPKTPSQYARRAHEGARLWAVSEQLCGIEAQG